MSTCSHTPVCSTLREHFKLVLRNNSVLPPSVDVEDYLEDI